MRVCMCARVRKFFLMFSEAQGLEFQKLNRRNWIVCARCEEEEKNRNVSRLSSKTLFSLSLSASRLIFRSHSSSNKARARFFQYCVISNFFSSPGIEIERSEIFRPTAQPRKLCVKLETHRNLTWAGNSTLSRICALSVAAYDRVKWNFISLSCARLCMIQVRSIFEFLTYIQTASWVRRI